MNIYENEKNTKMVIHLHYNEDGSVRKRSERRKYREKVWYYYGNGVVRCIFEKRNGKYHGRFQLFYRDGGIQRESFYRNDRRHGMSQRFFRSGKVRDTYFYHHGYKEGQAVLYFPNGSTKTKISYRHDKKDGLECHYDKSGTLSSKQYYTNGQKNGYCYINNRRHMIEAIYQSGKLHGLWIKFILSNGQTIGQQSCNFLNGKPHGFSTEKNKQMLIQLENGSWRTVDDAYSVGSYFYGKKFGQWKTLEGNHVIQQREYFNDTFHGTNLDIDVTTGTSWSQEYKFGQKEGVGLFMQNNVIRESTSYVNNKKHGLAKIFSETGTLLQEYSYVEDKKMGPCRIYNENEKLISLLNYKNDSVEGLVWWTDNDSYQSLAIYAEGKKNGLQWTCSPTGLAFQSAEYCNDILHGNFYQFFPTGELEKLEHYRYGLMDGIQYTYYKDGKLKECVTYQDGLLHGTYTSFFPNQMLHLLVHFQNNLFHGEFQMRTESGMVIQKGRYWNNKLEGWAKLADSTGIFTQGNTVVLSSKLEAECVICYEKTKSWTTCKHPICFACVRKYLKTSFRRMHCPYCREPFSNNIMTHPASGMTYSFPMEIV